MDFLSQHIFLFSFQCFHFDQLILLIDTNGCDSFKAFGKVCVSFGTQVFLSEKACRQTTPNSHMGFMCQLVIIISCRVLSHGYTAIQPERDYLILNFYFNSIFCFDEKYLFVWTFQYKDVFCSFISLLYHFAAWTHVAQCNVYA